MLAISENRLEHVLRATRGLLTPQQRAVLEEVKRRPPPRENPVLAIVPDEIACSRCKEMIPNRGRHYCRPCERVLDAKYRERRRARA